MSRLELFSGDTKTLNITVLDENGAAKDITGSTIIWKLFSRHDDDTVKVSKDTTDGITLTDPTNGVFQVAIAGTDTATLDGGTYNQECQLTDSSSKIQTIIRETVVVKKDLIT